MIHRGRSSNGRVPETCGGDEIPMNAIRRRGNLQRAILAFHRRDEDEEDSSDDDSAHGGILSDEY